MRKAALFFLFPILAFARVDLQLDNPVLKDGVVSTDQGGFVRTDNLRVQAAKIRYDKTRGFLVADGGVAIFWHQKLIVAERLEYNTQTKSGKAFNAAGGIGAWVIRGDVLELKPEGVIAISRASVSTAQEGPPLWDVFSQKISVNQDEVLETKSVQVRVQKFPIFWIPGFRLNLKPIRDSTARYSVMWDKGQGPRFSMRYRLYSWNDFNLFGRFDYRWNRGPGGAIEATHKSPLSRMKSQNYYAHDTFFNDDDPNRWRKRYRFQGIWDTHTPNEKTYLHLQYDKYSDQNMPLDFKMEDFEFNRAKKSELIASHRFAPAYLHARLMPKLNPFETTRQELPTVDLSLQPIPIVNTGAYLTGALSSSFLDYAYSSDIGNRLDDFHSYRGEAKLRIDRPFSIQGLNVTPFGEVREILYSRSHLNRALQQSLFSWGLDLSTRFVKSTGSFKHALTPYVEYKGLSKPQHPTSEVFIFSFFDGWHRLNQIRFGAKQQFYFSTPLPLFEFDTYAYAMLGQTPFGEAIPWIDAKFTLNLDQIRFSSHARWNNKEHSFNFVNSTLAWTLSDSAAFSLELRHRSKYQWRSDAHDNFILNVSYPRDLLLTTPLSDGRNTILARVQLRPLPDWILRLALHAGFGRGEREPGYIESKLDLITQLTSSWNMKLGYMHTVRDDQFTCSFNLLAF